MQLDIGVHTIVLLVGPSQSGKSTWANIFKAKIAEISNGLRVSILSSDGLRRELIGSDLDRYDPQMAEVSEVAFNLLFAKLDALTQYPVNTEFVVIDTTGLDAEFRKRIQDHAKKVCYRTAIVSFDYSHSDYFKDLKSYEDKNIVSKHVDFFKKSVLPTIKKKSYDFSLTVKNKSLSVWESMKIDVIDYDIWKRCHFTENNFSTERDVIVIGDVHEHIVPLQSLLEKHKDKHVFFVGDIVDKGNNTDQAINYVLELIDAGATLVCGNHESFVARRLLGEIKTLDDEDELFPSLKTIMNDTDLQQKFLLMYSKSIPFACIKTHGKTIYITHAPCHNKYIGKLDKNSQKNQRNFYFPSRDSNEMIDSLLFVQSEEKYAHPLHVFGHVAHNMNVEHKNKIWLDTGSVYGNKLSALIVDKKGNKKVVFERTVAVTKGDLFNMKKNKDLTTVVSLTAESKVSAPGEDGKLIDIEKIVDKYKLSPDARYWLENFSESGARFVSGTMSPSKSSVDQLEPIQTAIDYYYSKGVDKVIVQPKFMGSRLQVYLFRDSTKDFAITRSGHRIGHVEAMKTVFKDLHERFDRHSFWKEHIIFDGELLPWSLMAKDLIEKDFLQYGQSIHHELHVLDDDSVFKAFNIEENLIEKKRMIDVFLQQAKWFGREDVVSYKAFSILTVDNELWVDRNQEDVFTMLNSEPYLVIDTSKESYEKAGIFFSHLTQRLNEKDLGCEGVVVKPLLWKPGIAPYMKVRNSDYLHLIYGYDYKLNYDQMIKSKRIGKKLDLSIKEYELGVKMLVTRDKAELMELACQIQFEIEKEKELDVRL